MNRRTTRRRYLAVAGAAGAGMLAGCLDPGGDASDESLPEYLDDLVPDLLDRYDVPGASLAVVEGGEVTWTGAYGEADPAEGRPTTTDTPFRVQSITKSVTAWGVMELVERDEISLDDPVGRHLTSWEPPDAEHSWDGVTVRRLLTHSAGLPAGHYEGVPPDEEPPALREALSGDADGPAARPVDEPGDFRYSNPGYALLELLIEDVTGRDFAAYLDEAVLAPLGMDGATFAWTDRIRSELATEHYVDGTQVPPLRGPARAPGGLFATAEDVGEFVAASVRGEGGEPAGRGVLDPESVEEMHAPAVETTGFYDVATDGAGLGHFAEELPGDELAVMNGGQGAGSWNWFHAVPETGDGVVVLTNSERGLQLIGDVVRAWADRSGLPPVAVGRAVRWIRAPVWAIGLAAGGLALRLGYGIATGGRSFDPRSGRDRTARAVLSGIAVALAGLWWALGREFVGFFLPVIAEWVGLALTAVAAVVVLTALFPRTGGDEPE